MTEAPFIAISRLRMLTDGDGVTTLAAFYGCPLRCKYCLNPQSFSSETKTKSYTPRELYDEVKIDELYFLATGGGIAFGGGEPLLYPEFIKNFRNVCGNAWKIWVETSLNVPWENIEGSVGAIDKYIIDCKDTNSDIYKKYTGKDNKIMLENLKRLIILKGAENITVRVPLIEGYNTEDDRTKTIEKLLESGVLKSKIDTFKYRISA